MELTPRDQLIQVLTTYLSKPHILMKGPMKFYLTRLRSGQNLKVSHIRTLLPYLRWDLRPMTDQQLLIHFSEITRSHRQPVTMQPTHTLEACL